MIALVHRRLAFRMSRRRHALARLMATVMAIALILAPTPSAMAQHMDWQASLDERLTAIDQDYRGDIGVHVRRLADDERLGFRDAEPWYWASLVKVPVAVELLDRVGRGEIDLDERMALERDDYVDGAGATNWAKPGSPIRLRTLLERMLIQSDNTATDMLMRRVGLEAVNARARTLAGPLTGPITTLLDVRRHLYAAATPKAATLTGLQTIDLRQSAFGEPRLRRLAQITGTPRNEFLLNDLATAYARYYATGLNSGRLDHYADLLARIDEGQALAPEMTSTLLTIMQRVATGHARLQAGFSHPHAFAQKTGTQYARFCDAGIVAPRTADAVVVVACLRGAPSKAEANRAFQAIGEAIEDSGVLDRRG